MVFVLFRFGHRSPVSGLRSWVFGFCSGLVFGLLGFGLPSWVFFLFVLFFVFFWGGASFVFSRTGFEDCLPYSTCLLCVHVLAGSDLNDALSNSCIYPTSNP